MKKPDPEFFTTVLRKAGFPAKKTLFVDDRQENVNVAKSVGMRAERVELSSIAGVVRRAVRRLD